MSFNKFLDFDKDKEVVFYNLYLNDYKYAIKIPISEMSSENHLKEIKIEKFDLNKYNFLLNCEK